MKISNSLRFLYLGRSPSVHDIRFIDALSELGEVRSYFLNSGALFPTSHSINEEFNLVIAGPLTDVITILPSGIKIPTIGISFATDINEEILSEGDLILFQENLQKLDSIIVDCQYSKSRILELSGFTGNILVVPFGCDFNHYSKCAPHFVNEIRIIVTRNWEDVHENLTILKALKIVTERTNVQATFLGKGPNLNQEVKDFLPSTQNSEITFLGFTGANDLLEKFSENWCYVSASRSDGASISLLEAMSAGLVCVTTDFSANLEWIVDGETGFTFRNGDPMHLARVLERIGTLDRNYLKKVGLNARERVSNDGNWQINVVKFQNFILQSAIENL